MKNDFVTLRQCFRMKISLNEHWRVKWSEDALEEIRVWDNHWPISWTLGHHLRTCPANGPVIDLSLSTLFIVIYKIQAKDFLIGETVQLIQWSSSHNTVSYLKTVKAIRETLNCPVLASHLFSRELLFIYEVNIRTVKSIFKAVFIYKRTSLSVLWAWCLRSTNVWNHHCLFMNGWRQNLNLWILHILHMLHPMWCVSRVKMRTLWS